MISISEVYDAVRDLANKDQRGFVTPAVFNTFAGVAQQNIYNKMFDGLVKSKSLRRSDNDPARHMSTMQQLEEDLSYYIEERLLPEIDDEGDVETIGGQIQFEPEPDEYITVARPLDIKKIISIRSSDQTRNSVEIVHDAEKINRILNSNLSSPTEDFPVAFVKDNTIQIFPDTMAIDNIVVMFYRQPRSRYVFGQNMGGSDLNNLPRYAFIQVNQISGFVVQDVSNSRNFDLPEHYKNDLIVEMSKLIGIRLRDNFMSQYMNMEESKQ